MDSEPVADTTPEGLLDKKTLRVFGLEVFDKSRDSSLFDIRPIT